MTMQYKTGTDSSVGANVIPFYYYKKALIDLKKEQYFGQMADVRSMPKHMGKTIKQFHYLPLLDDRNINDQGIDANGVTIATTEWFVSYPSASLSVVNASKVAAVAAINDNVGTTLVATAGADDSAGTGFATITLVGELTAKYLDSTKVDAIEAFNLGVSVLQGSGNLYGSSKDIGLIQGKLPVLSETGGRVNRLGFKRLTIEGTIEKFGFFSEYTQESLDFDNEEDLLSHITRESVRGANESVEDMLQIDLINGAGVVLRGGSATDNITTTGEAGDPSILDYGMFVKMDTELNNNRCPKNTTIITGSRMVDTRTINAARYAYLGSELKQSILKMVDFHGAKAFIPVQNYAEAGNVATGEIGAIDNFRIIEVPEMLNWSGAGATVEAAEGFYETNGKFDIFPVLVVGSGSFTTIGFQTNGKTVKFEIIHKKPGKETADRTDPYGETGHYAIKWYYGTMILRPEWLGLMKVVAEI